jgi:hypothetical protein
MDERVDAGGDTSRFTERDTAALAFGPLPRPGELARRAQTPTDQPVPQ